MFILRAISRRPIPDTYATLICSHRSKEILLRIVRFASGSWPFLALAHVRMNIYALLEENAIAH
jgi:hypothetical protein